jgi:DNA-binding NarL/FixJ family response regulator
MENPYDLDEEEILILHRKVEGWTSKDIARELGVSDVILSGKLTRICQKLGVRTKAMAARKAAMELFDLKVEPRFLLTEKEKEVIRLLLEDLTTNGISRRLQIAPQSVDDRIHRACRKYGAHSRDHLACLITLPELM